MGKVFGLIGMLCGLAAVGLIWFFFGWWILVLAILGIVFGAIGIAKDDSKAMGVVGLIFGIIGLVLWIIFPLVFLVLLAGLLGGLLSP
ncbi:MAG: hypothetical protein ACFFDY_05670 [Candidatus Thorarchaeota archaeon]